MSAIIDRLQLDHERFRTLLASFESLLDDAESGDVSAADQLYCLLDYLTDYPEQIHHPTEDVLFKALKGHVSDDAWLTIEQNLKAHVFLEQHTSDLLNAVDHVDPDFLSIREHAEAYVKAQLTHLEFEEKELFPLVEHALDNAGVKLIEEQLAKLEDPLFDQRVARFGVLYQLLDPHSEHFKNKGLDAGARFLAST